MSSKKSAVQILKERLSVLAVIVSCLVLVMAAQATQQYLAAQEVEPTATPAAVATATPRAETTPPGPAASEKTATAEDSQTPQPLPKKPSNLSGTWVGTLADTVEGNVFEYAYTLQLSQQGAFISGKSAIEKEDDPEAYANFVIRGQILQSNDMPVQLTEDLLEAKNLRDGSAAAPRTIRLNYFAPEEGEAYLEGEWIDRRYSSDDVTGTVKVTKQP